MTRWSLARTLRSYTAYHPIILWIVGGTLLTRFTSFMVMPFMAIYMKVHTGASTGVIGLAIGAAALTSMSLGLIGGTLADKYGRKGLMIAALIINIFTMIGYANARHILIFFVLSIGSGLTRVLFEPSSKSMLTDLATERERSNVFALRYTAINIGAAVGPIVGGYFGTVSTGWTFYLCALANLIYLCFVIAKFPGQKNASIFRSNDGGTPIVSTPFSFLHTVQTLLFDRALLLFLIAAFLSSFGYSQIDTTLPQAFALTMDPTRAAALFGVILSSNAIEVVILQMPIARLVGRMGLVQSMMLGQLIFAIGYIVMGIAHSTQADLVAMFIITLGEIIIFPQNSQYISELAPPTMRASYFGAWSLADLGTFMGPWLGGMVLPWSGRALLFSMVGVGVGIGIPFLHWSNNHWHRTRSVVKNSLTIE